MILERVPQRSYDCAFHAFHWEETMPEPAPKTDKWTARENKQGKLGIVLIVSGLVQVSNTGKHPRLKDAGAGGKAKTLVLDLSIETAGQGADVLAWKRATFSKDVSAGQYDGVEIRWDGKTIASCEVRSDEEHHLHLVALTQAANKAQGAAKRPAPAKPKARPGAKKPAGAKKKRPAAAKKKAAPAKKRAPAAKKRAPAAKKRRSAAPKARGAAAAKKRRAGSVKKRPVSAKKRRPAAAQKRRLAARKR
jgi:hypothetical protein